MPSLNRVHKTVCLTRAGAEVISMAIRMVMAAATRTAMATEVRMVPIHRRGRLRRRSLRPRHLLPVCPPIRRRALCWRSRAPLRLHSPAMSVPAGVLGMLVMRDHPVCCGRRPHMRRLRRRLQRSSVRCRCCPRCRRQHTRLCRRRHGRCRRRHPRSELIRGPHLRRLRRRLQRSSVRCRCCPRCRRQHTRLCRRRHGRCRRHPRSGLVRCCRPPRSRLIPGRAHPRRGQVVTVGTVLGAGECFVAPCPCFRY